MKSLQEVFGIVLIIPAIHFYINYDFNNEQLQPLLEFIGVTGKKELLYFILISFAVFMLFKSFIAKKIIYSINEKLISFRQDVSIRMFKTVLNQSYLNYLDEDKNNIIKRLVTSINQFNSSLIIPFASFFGEVILLTFFLLFVLYLNFLFTLYLVMFLFGFSYVYFKFIKKNLINDAQIVQRSELKRIKTINEYINLVKEINIFNKEDLFRKNYNSSEDTIAIKQLNYMNQVDFFKINLEFILVFFLASFILFFNNNSLIEPSVDILPFIVFLGVVIARIIPSFNRINSAITSLSFGAAALDDIYSLAKVEKKLNNTKKLRTYPLVRLKENELLKVENLSFRYNEFNTILNNISLTIYRNEKIGIYGKSGSGKTTLIHIILGLLKPTDGSIYLNSKLKDLYFENKLFGYVSQDFNLLDGTVLDNVCFGEDKKNISEAIKALKVSSFVNQNENDRKFLNNDVGHNGINLSGGQRQRLCIARAIYHGAKIIIFDEPSSALDKKTQDELMTNILNLPQSITIIMISHNLNIFKSFNRILKISNKGIRQV